MASQLPARGFSTLSESRRKIIYGQDIAFRASQQDDVYPRWFDLTRKQQRRSLLEGWAREREMIKPSALTDGSDGDFGIIHINDQLLPGYTQEAINRLCADFGPGLRARVSIIDKAFCPVISNIDLFIRDGQIHHHLAKIVIPLKRVADGVRHDKLSTADLGVVEHMSLTASTPISGMDHAPKPMGYSDAALDILPEMSEPQSPTDCWKYLCTAIQEISWRIAITDFHVVYSSQFYDELLRYHPNVQAIAHAVKDLLQEDDFLHFEITMPSGNMSRQKWELISEELADQNSPFEGVFYERGRCFEELRFQTMHLPEIPDHAAAVPRFDTFVDGEHRTVTLLMAAIEEEHFSELCAESIEITSRPFIIVADNDSLWESNKDDMDVYGIPADGVAQRVLLPVSDLGDNGPGVGQIVDIYLELEIYNRRKVIAHPSTAEIADGAGKICSVLATARMKAYAKKRNEIRLFERARVAGDFSESEIRIHAARLETLEEVLYHKLGTYALLPFVKQSNVPNECKKAFDNRYLLRRGIALDWLHALTRYRDELDADHTSRVQAFILQHAGNMCLRTAASRERLDRPLRGKLLKKPPGVRGDVSVFSAAVPREADWYEDYEAPPVIIDCSKMALLQTDSDIPTLMQAISDGRPLQPSIEGHLVFAPDQKLIRRECEAITAMNNTECSGPIRGYWKHVMNFASFPEHLERDLLDEFPELNRRIDNGHFSPEHRDAILSLCRTKGGVSVIAGHTGADVSALGIDIISAIVHSVQVQRPSRTHTPEPGVGKGKEKAAYYDPGWEAFEPVTKYLERCRVAWISEDEHRVDQACSRLLQSCPEKTVCRLHTFQQEIFNVDQRLKRRPEERFVTSYDTGAVRGDEQSFSNIAKRIAFKNPDYHSPLLHLWENSYEFFMKSESMDEEVDSLLEELLRRTLASIDIVCATPDTFAQLLEEFEYPARIWQPALGIIDDAGKMTESQCFIPMAKFPAAAWVLLGIREESGLVSKAHRSEEFNDIFGLQRSVSLFDRYAAAGSFDFVLGSPPWPDSSSCAAPSFRLSKYPASSKISTNGSPHTLARPGDYSRRRALQESKFLNLPYDVRHMVYTKLYESTNIHIHWAEGKKLRTFCRLKVPMRLVDRRWIHCTCDGSDEKFPYYKKLGQKNTGGHKWHLVSFIFLCKQVYEEALPVLYDKAVFNFYNANELIFFDRHFRHAPFFHRIRQVKIHIGDSELKEYSKRVHRVEYLALVIEAMKELRTIRIELGSSARDWPAPTLLDQLQEYALLDPRVTILE